MNINNVKEYYDGKYWAIRKGVAALVLVTVAFVFSFSPIQGTNAIYAADYEKWEDCDWDGYDDHTGVKVPWPGFDGTRGDTPAGPSPDSQTGKQKAKEENNDSSTTTTTTKNKSTEAKSKNKTNSKKKSGSPTDADKKSNEKTDEIDIEEDTTDEGKLIETTDTSIKENHSDINLTEKQREAAIIDKKGEVEITSTEGRDFYEGGEITLKGTGFYGDVEDIEIEIHSTPKTLGNVSSDPEGNFETKLVLPEGIGEGSHNIVVLYKGAELVSTPLEVKQAPVGSFLQALTIGFAGDNAELPLGVILFIALIAVGLIVLFFGEVRRRRNVSQSR